MTTEGRRLTDLSREEFERVRDRQENHAVAIGQLQTQVTSNGIEIANLRKFSHSSAEKAQENRLKLDALEEDMDVMTRTLENRGERLRKLEAEQSSGTTNYSWLIKILGFALGIANTIAVAMFIWTMQGHH